MRPSCSTKHRAHLLGCALLVAACGGCASYVDTDQDDPVVTTRTSSVRVETERTPTVSRTIEVDPTPSTYTTRTEYRQVPVERSTTTRTTTYY